MIIGIGGRKGSGKDTVADMLVEEFNFKKIAFADNLKKMCMEVFKLTRGQCYNEIEKEVLFEKPILFTQEHAVDIIRWATEVNKFPVKMIDTYLIDILIDREIKFRSTRQLLQYVGTEVCRDCFDPDFHAKATFATIEKFGWKSVAISDARFRNERNFIENMKGFNVLIIGPKAKLEDTHRSENDLGVPEEYDWCIYNHKLNGLCVLEANVICMHNMMLRF